MSNLIKLSVGAFTLGWGFGTLLFPTPPTPFLDGVVCIAAGVFIVLDREVGYR